MGTGQSETGSHFFKNKRMTCGIKSVIMKFEAFDLGFNKCRKMIYCGRKTGKKI